MDWLDYHLHEFSLGDIRIGIPDEDYGEKIFNSAKVKLKTYIRSEGQRFSYSYDFGDCWLCDVTVEKILDEEPGGSYPRCTDGKLAGPCEDCGGITGHYNLLRILADKKNPEYREMKTWAGDYDPVRFNIKEINKHLETGIERG